MKKLPDLFLGAILNCLQIDPKYMATHVKGGGDSFVVPGTDISLQKDLLEEIGLAQMARQRSGPHSLAKREGLEI